MQTSTAPAMRSQGKGALIAKFADKFGVDQDKLLGILKATCFKQAGTNAPDVTNEQMAALLVVADQYNLNPFTKEIYAFPDSGKGIVPIIGVDGWMRIVNEHPAMDGFEFRPSENIVQIDEDAKPCPEFVDVVIHRKDRSRPVVVREYLDECYKPVGTYKDGNKMRPGPWQSHTKRFLRHKALIQAARIAFGFGGVYDEDEGERIATARVVDMTSGMPAAIDVSPTPDTSEFDRLAADVADDPQFVAFCSETARANGMTVDALKVEAAKHFDSFIQGFRSWAAKALDAPGVTLEMPPQREAEKVESKTKSDKKQSAQQTDTRASVSCPNRMDEETGKCLNVLTTACDSCAQRGECPSWK